MKENNKNIDNSLKLIAKSAFIIFIGLALSKIFTYLYRIIIARYYGPEAFGLFSLAIIILSFLTSIASLGLLEGLLRYVSFFRGKKEVNKIRDIIKFSKYVLLFSSIFFGLLLFFLSNFIALTIFHNPRLIFYLKIFSIGIPLSIFSGLYLYVLRSYEKISAYSFNLNILQNISRLIIISFLIFLGVNYASIPISYTFGVALVLISSYLFCKYKIPEIFIKDYKAINEKENIRKDLFSYSWPIMFLSAISNVFFWIDSFVIGYFKNALEVGIYNSATSIVSLLWIVPDLFLQFMLPLITKEFSKKKHIVIRELSKQIGKWIFVLNLPVFILMFFFPGTFINIFFGQEYLPAQEPLRILAIGGLISGFIALCTNLISMIGKSRLILFDTITFSLINLALNIILVPRFGLIGAAYATTISGAFLGMVLIYQVRYYLSFVPFRKKIIRIILVSIIPTMLLIMLSRIATINIFSLALLGALFILLYFLCLLLTGCLDKNDLMTLGAIKKRIMIAIY